MNNADHVRKKMFERQGGLCAYCDVPMADRWTGVLDHTWPRSKGGIDAVKNRALVCRRCDWFKSNIATYEEAYDVLLERLEFFAMLRDKGIIPTSVKETINGVPVEFQPAHFQLSKVPPPPPGPRVTKLRPLPEPASPPAPPKPHPNMEKDRLAKEARQRMAMESDHPPITITNELGMSLYDWTPGHVGTHLTMGKLKKGSVGVYRMQRDGKKGDVLMDLLELGMLVGGALAEATRLKNATPEPVPAGG